jgi:hypothetical protein
MALYLIMMIWLIWGSEDEYFLYNIIISGNDTSQIFMVLEVEIISTPVVLVVVVVVVLGGLFRGRSSSWSRRSIPR